MRLTVIGAGYVGLTTAATLAWCGHDTWVVEVDGNKLARLGSFDLPFFEPHLRELVDGSRERLHFTADLRAALSGASVVYIAVGTPPTATGAPDMAYVYAAFEQVLDSLGPEAPDLLVVNKSTVPVGTRDAMNHRIAERGLVGRVEVASNPEFLRQGRAVRDCLFPDRIVLGGSTRAIDILREVYRPIVERQVPVPEGLEAPETTTPVPVYAMSGGSAELTKYAANAFLATRISFINEVANLCDAVGADIDEVATAIGADPRIGGHFLHAGVGYGGSCFPKDTRALHHIATSNGYQFELLSAVIRVNEIQKYRVVEKLEDALGGLAGRRVAFLGLSFKPDTDDMREAPSVPLAEALLQRGAEVRAHDPHASSTARAVLPAGAQLCGSVEEALADADAAVLLTEWREYLELAPERFAELMRRPLIVDGRNAFGRHIRDHVEYMGIGRPRIERPLEPPRDTSGDPYRRISAASD